MRIKLTSVILVAALGASTISLADNAGAGGKLVKIYRRTSSHSVYAYYHAAFNVDETGDGISDRTYYTGGAYCDVAELSTTDKDALQQALQNGLTVSFEYVIGPTPFSARCVTAYAITP